jgi:phage/conjugal plasmid C-4 type zinc finger TraR family protein
MILEDFHAATCNFARAHPSSTITGGKARIARASMATGWAGDGAVQDQIDATVRDGIKRAQSRLPQGPSATHCVECGAEIPEARRAATPGVRMCVPCQEAEDREKGGFTGGYNRRGSKDSQLR